MAAHFDFISFSAWPFVDSWPQFFYMRGVLVGIYAYIYYIHTQKYKHTYIHTYIHRGVERGVRRVRTNPLFKLDFKK